MGDTESSPGVPTSRRDWDQFTKVAVEAGLSGVLTQVGIDVPAEDLVAVPVEFPASVRLVDRLYSGPDGFYLHVEIQQRPHPWMGPRMMEYLGRIVAGPQLLGKVREIRQVVVQLSGPAMPTHHDFGGAVLDFHLLHTPTTPLEVFLQTPALAPFGLTSDDPDAVGPVVDRIAQITDPDLQASTALLAVFLAPNTRTTLTELIRRNVMIDTYEEMLAEMRHTSLGHDLIDEGRHEGRQEGRRAALLTAVVDMLTARFPDADLSRVERTAQRLLAQDDTHTVRLALTVSTLDD